MNIVDLQRRQLDPRADELLDGLQAAIAENERVHWNETGHARLHVGGAVDSARVEVAARLAQFGDDWPDHIAIL
jgi:DNA-binding transcriptional LysR family regulator